MTRSRKLRRFGRDERAAVTIEFVLAIPLFLSVLAFSFEFGRLFLAHQSTVNNVRAATRYITRVETETGSQRSDARTAADNLVRTGNVNGGIAPDYLNGTNATVNVNIPDPDDSDQVSITVRVNFPLAIFNFTDTDDNAPAAIPFVIQERARHVGM